MKTSYEEEEEKLNPTAGTITRTAVMIIGIVNLILNATGHSTLPFTTSEVSNAISVIFSVIATILVWWKNNSFTAPAKQADIWMKEMKAKEKKG